MNPSGAQAPYASLIDATYRYGAVEALSGVSLEVRDGEVVALLGPNGAGKTTAVNLMLGLLRPQSGSARLFGGAPRDSINISRVGVMLQASGVPETLKVRELVDQFRAYYPAPLPAEEVIDLVGLEGLEGRLYGKLSGGQKQRLLFALALCGDPHLLFLDEPTVGLDVESRQGFWQIIQRLAGEGRSVLLTTHYLEEADALADRVVVLDEGRVLTQGDTAAIRRLASTARITAVTTTPAVQISNWEGVHDVSEDPQPGEARPGASRVQLISSAPESVTLRLLQADPGLSGLEVRQGTLEDAFLALLRDANGVAASARPSGGKHTPAVTAGPPPVALHHVLTRSEA